MKQAKNGKTLQMMCCVASNRICRSAECCRYQVNVSADANVNVDKP